MDAGRRRVAIEGISPQVDGGRWPVKRIQNDTVVVEANVFADGHDEVRAVLLLRHEHDEHWSQLPFEPLGNDRWRTSFVVEQLGTYRYTVCGWIDRFSTWRHDFEKRVAAGSDVLVDLAIGARLVEETADRAGPGADGVRLTALAAILDGSHDAAARSRLAVDAELLELMEKYPDLELSTTYEPELRLSVERPLAGFSAWYEMFPRSASAVPGRHGTFADCEARLPYVAQMGFDILYLPPIHPIGMAFRKGKNNATTAQPGDFGSPWAIGGADGGHKACHRELGTIKDFRRLLAAAKTHGIEIALDLAYQCSPDHPYAAEHPEWFLRRPDGTIQYAENPPKKYQDIYPFYFETSAWRPLWEELKSVVTFWIGEGVRVFRVDNPHTKPFAFWEWLIGDIRRQYPDVIFLAEAFTRPKIMYRLAKLGFTQSYTYFSWRNTRQELAEYFQELTQPELRNIFRPNLWPNTPDILPEYLQTGGRGAFVTRLILAATLGANYGIYGPAFELCESQPMRAGSEEYLNSEKYELRSWPLDRPDSLRELIGRVNRIRRGNPALQRDANIEFHPVDNAAQQLLCYSKRTDDFSNRIVVVANLDPRVAQAGMVHLQLDRLGIPGDQPYLMHDLLSDKSYGWRGSDGYVELAPDKVAAHVFQVRRWLRSEGGVEVFEP
ncbi:MAG TPA: alpha-1,4-glucan--maltose-1-phosphate maltosyltransferase [Pirellulales bacterium]|nr:alpha-1,4-glucan--maltose-1-phosphate maltosyltransferase [Pirellulales bacterium]